MKKKNDSFLSPACCAIAIMYVFTKLCAHNDFYCNNKLVYLYFGLPPKEH